MKADAPASVTASFTYPPVQSAGIVTLSATTLTYGTTFHDNSGLSDSDVIDSFVNSGPTTGA